MAELALYGGRPVRDDWLPYSRQWIEEDDISRVVEVLRGPWITQGPWIEAFERAIAERVGAKYAVAFANGTAALHAAMFAAGVGPGDEVVTTPITFVASANCAAYVGARPVFADIDPTTYNLDPAKVEQAMSPRTRAIVAVDFAGQPADLDALADIARRYGAVLIEDAAHALGAIYRGRPVGSIADMTMFSFHPVKAVTTGEGGIVVTNCDDYADKLRRFRSHGIVHSGTERDEGPWYYEMVDLGYNYRLTDIQAALGLSQLDKLDRFLLLRRKYAEDYTRAFTEMDEVIVPAVAPYAESAWHLYVLQFRPERLEGTRRFWFEALRAENIGVHVHYIPVHLHPYYRRTFGYGPGLCPVAEAWYERVVTLPLFPKMTEEDAASVIQAVRKVVRHFRRGGRL